ncbi:MAG: hypothetical protein ABIH34_03110 [Nanoarchaeota archaeon]
MKRLIRKGITILANPEMGFQHLQHETLEQAMSDYLKMLLMVGGAAGVMNLLFRVGRALYLDMFLSTDIEYGRMLNYSLSQASALFFFFVFAGTFLFFFLSIILKMFFRKLGYPLFLKLMFFSAAPLLLFGWIPLMPFPLFIWSAFLLVVGARTSTRHHIKKTSIEQRD